MTAKLDCSKSKGTTPAPFFSGLLENTKLLRGQRLPPIQPTLRKATTSKCDAKKSKSNIISKTFPKLKESDTSGSLVKKRKTTNCNSQSVSNSNSARSVNFLRSSKSNNSKKLQEQHEWKSPFKSFITSGVRMRNSGRQKQTTNFAYDLSRDELKHFGTCKGPMKPASEAERQLLHNGQRTQYLNQRYEHSPNRKYNYPEATSWRIGWLHKQQKASSSSHLNMEYKRVR